MYERILDEKALAAEVVDRLRDTTDAPLAACVEAARAVIGTISEFVSDAAFERIAGALLNYEVDVDNCRDRQVLEMVGDSLEGIFKEKEELSYSASQNDVRLIEYLRVFADIVSKTDSRISMKAASRDDFIWLNSLINVYRMDQNDEVKAGVIFCLDVLTKNCPKLAPFFVESQLPVIIALQTPPPTKQMNSHELRALDLLDRVLSTASQPPLSHFETINVGFTQRLLGHFENQSNAVINCLVSINSAVPAFGENPVIRGLRSCRVALFGEVFTSKINKQCTESSIKLLANILKEDNLLDDLFYSNDLVVLRRVLGRELLNNDNEKIRVRCLEVIEDLIRYGVPGRDLQEAVEQSTVDPDLRKRVLDLLDSP